MGEKRKPGIRMGLLFEQRVSLTPTYFTLTGSLWKPATDIIETKDAFLLRLEIAGVPEEAVSITADNDLLIVRGHRTEDRRGETIRYHTLELQYGKFERVFRFPFSLAQQDVRATFRCGILAIEVPKKQSTDRPLTIEIIEAT